MTPGEQASRTTQDPHAPEGRSPVGSAIVVAVDGTSGSGKSSTCRGVAERLGLRYLDTGAMFRAVTWWMLDRGVDVHDADAVSTALAADPERPLLLSGTDPTAPTIEVDGTDVSVAIRGPEVTAAVSPVSTVPAVRRRLLTQQRTLIEQAQQATGIVVEGRDIGSVVWPQAEVKVYLTADPAARAARRAAEQGARDADQVAATEASLRERDRSRCGRAAAPLVQADGAVHLDTTDHTLDEVVDLIVGLVSSTERRSDSPAGARR